MSMTTPSSISRLPLSSDGAVSGDVVIPAGAALGYYTIRLGDGERCTSPASFHVEDYRKPEYQVRVHCQTPRVLQGRDQPVVIDSRYFFGEPVAFGKVKYRIYHSPHYWWDEDESSGDSSDTGSGDQDQSDTDMYGADQQSEQTGQARRQRQAHHQRSDQGRLLRAPHRSGLHRRSRRDRRSQPRDHRPRPLPRHLRHLSHPRRAGQLRRPPQATARTLTVTAVDYDNKPGPDARAPPALTWHRMVKRDDRHHAGATTDVDYRRPRHRAHDSARRSGRQSAEVHASSTNSGKPHGPRRKLAVGLGRQRSQLVPGRRTVRPDRRRQKVLRSRRHRAPQHRFPGRRLPCPGRRHRLLPSDSAKSCSPTARPLTSTCPSPRIRSLTSTFRSPLLKDPALPGDVSNQSSSCRSSNCRSISNRQGCLPAAADRRL